MLRNEVSVCRSGVFFSGIVCTFTPKSDCCLLLRRCKDEGYRGQHGVSYGRPRLLARWSWQRVIVRDGRIAWFARKGHGSPKQCTWPRTRALIENGIRILGRGVEFHIIPWLRAAVARYGWVLAVVVAISAPMHQYEQDDVPASCIDTIGKPHTILCPASRWQCRQCARNDDGR
jgi:hypothetical protein